VKSALRNDLERLRRDALSVRHRHAFEAGRAKQPAIAAHADAASVLAMLDDEAEGTYAAREALTEGDHHRAPGEPRCGVGVPPARRVQADAGAPAGPPRQRHGAGR
jgi:hypothetical protein